MASARVRRRDKQLNTLVKENLKLHKDIEDLESAYLLHRQITDEDQNSVTGLLRKEIGGSRWEHGGSGKLTTYKVEKQADQLFGQTNTSNDSNLNTDHLNGHQHEQRFQENGSNSNRLEDARRVRAFADVSSVNDDIMHECNDKISDLKTKVLKKASSKLIRRESWSNSSDTQNKQAILETPVNLRGMPTKELGLLANKPVKGKSVPRNGPLKNDKPVQSKRPKAEQRHSKTNGSHTIGEENKRQNSENYNERPRVESKKTLSANEIHRYLQPSCTQPARRSSRDERSRNNIDREVNNDLNQDSVEKSIEVNGNVKLNSDVKKSMGLTYTPRKVQPFVTKSPTQTQVNNVFPTQPVDPTEIYIDPKSGEVRVKSCAVEQPHGPALNDETVVLLQSGLVQKSLEQYKVPCTIVDDPSSHRVPSNVRDIFGLGTFDTEPTGQAGAEISHDADKASSSPFTASKDCDTEVEFWLRGLGLPDVENVVRIFAENAVDLLDVEFMTAAQLHEMGVTGLGTLDKILKGVKLLKNTASVGKTHGNIRTQTLTASSIAWVEDDAVKNKQPVKSSQTPSKLKHEKLCQDIEVTKSFDNSYTNNERCSSSLSNVSENNLSRGAEAVSQLGFAADTRSSSARYTDKRPPSAKISSTSKGSSSSSSSQSGAKASNQSSAKPKRTDSTQGDRGGIRGNNLESKPKKGVLLRPRSSSLTREVSRGQSKKGQKLDEEKNVRETRVRSRSADAVKRKALQGVHAAAKKYEEKQSKTKEPANQPVKADQIARRDKMAARHLQREKNKEVSVVENSDAGVLVLSNRDGAIGGQEEGIESLVTVNIMSAPHSDPRRSVPEEMAKTRVVSSGSQLQKSLRRVEPPKRSGRSSGRAAVPQLNSDIEPPLLSTYKLGGRMKEDKVVSETESGYKTDTSSSYSQVQDKVSEIQLKIKRLKARATSGDDMTLALVRDLQGQLKDFEKQLAQKPSDSKPQHDSRHQPVGLPTNTGDSTRQSRSPVRRSRRSVSPIDLTETLPVHKSVELPSPHSGRTSGRSSPIKGIATPGSESNALGPDSPNKDPDMVRMSKKELLHEIKKEKKQHHRQIRQLQSELDRVRQKDQICNIELNEKDIKFDKYDVIGEGMFSKVYKGQYQGSEVAVKCLKAPLQSQDKNYFAAEVSLLKELRHPRVVLLVGVCTTSKLPLMVLEYMSKGSLHKHLHDQDRECLDHALYYQIARDIAAGMNYLHSHRPEVLHLDLKSLNVLLCQSLRAKIADFGFSKLSEKILEDRIRFCCLYEAATDLELHVCQVDFICLHGTERVKHPENTKLVVIITTGEMEVKRHDAGQKPGKKTKKTKPQFPSSLPWMAPELLDKGEVTGKADVYSYGIILWEMLTRDTPYQDNTVFQILELVRKKKRPVIPDSTPDGLQALIQDCWDNNQARRPQFKDIITRLETLAFPTAWRDLFKKAGVPDAALHNLESTRKIIDIVSSTLGGSNKNIVNSFKLPKPTGSQEHSGSKPSSSRGVTPSNSRNNSSRKETDDWEVETISTLSGQLSSDESVNTVKNMYVGKTYEKKAEIYRSDDDSLSTSSEESGSLFKKSTEEKKPPKLELDIFLPNLELQLQSARDEFKAERERIERVSDWVAISLDDRSEDQSHRSNLCQEEVNTGFKLNLTDRSSRSGSPRRRPLSEAETLSSFPSSRSSLDSTARSLPSHRSTKSKDLSLFSEDHWMRESLDNRRPPSPKKFLLRSFSDASSVSLSDTMGTPKSVDMPKSDEKNPQLFKPISDETVSVSSEITPRPRPRARTLSNVDNSKDSFFGIPIHRQAAPAAVMTDESMDMLKMSSDNETPSKTKDINTESIDKSHDVSARSSLAKTLTDTAYNITPRKSTERTKDSIGSQSLCSNETEIIKSSKSNTASFSQDVTDIEYSLSNTISDQIEPHEGARLSSNTLLYSLESKDVSSRDTSTPTEPRKQSRLSNIDKPKTEKMCVISNDKDLLMTSPVHKGSEQKNSAPRRSDIGVNNEIYDMCTKQLSNIKAKTSADNSGTINGTNEPNSSRSERSTSSKPARDYGGEVTKSLDCFGKKSEKKEQKSEVSKSFVASQEELVAARNKIMASNVRDKSPQTKIKVKPLPETMPCKCDVNKSDKYDHCYEDKSQKTLMDKPTEKSVVKNSDADQIKFEEKEATNATEQVRVKLNPAEVDAKRQSLSGSIQLKPVEIGGKQKPAITPRRSKSIRESSDSLNVSQSLTPRSSDVKQSEGHRVQLNATPRESSDQNIRVQLMKELRKSGKSVLQEEAGKTDSSNDTENFSETVNRENRKTTTIKIKLRKDPLDIRPERKPEQKLDLNESVSDIQETKQGAFDSKVRERRRHKRDSKMDKSHRDITIQGIPGKNTIKVKLKKDPIAPKLSEMPSSPVPPAPPPPPAAFSVPAFTRSRSVQEEKSRMSLADEIKLRLNNRKSVPDGIKIPRKGGHGGSKGHRSAGGASVENTQGADQMNILEPQLSEGEPSFVVASMDLRDQKENLKSISRPHPDQLDDEEEVSQQQLSSIAEILRKAVMGRRVAMNEGGDSVSQSLESSATGWSIDTNLP